MKIKLCFCVLTSIFVFVLVLGFCVSVSENDKTLRQTLLTIDDDFSTVKPSMTDGKSKVLTKGIKDLAKLSIVDLTLCSF